MMSSAERRVTTTSRRQFATTHWSLVLAAGDGSSPRADEALARLCDTYWYPLYAYLRSRGYSAEDAQDLTQAFFVRVLEKGGLRQADPARGRFRSFILVSLKNFAANQHDRAVAQKRGGTHVPLSLDLGTAEGRLLLEPPTDDTPETIFDRRWAVTLLNRVVSRLQAESDEGSKDGKFDRLKAYLTGDEPRLSYAQTAADLGMSEGAVKVAVHRLRRRFRDLVRDEIAHTVSSPHEVDDELRHLMAAVAR
jgi:RNA polymerase sigma factor (sigma-70 family)